MLKHRSGPRQGEPFIVPDARSWSAEDPFLYDCVVRAEANGILVDEWTHRIGVRTIEVDAKKGLRINGKSVLLRGACIHHDNGILGAATHESAEYRRVRILKGKRLQRHPKCPQLHITANPARM